MSKVKIGNLTVDMTMTEQDVAEVQSRTPVRTGNLRDGFHVDLEGNISNDVEYANAVELGTINQPGRFMATQSAPAIAERLAKKMADEANKPGLIKLPDIIVKVGG